MEKSKRNYLLRKLRENKPVFRIDGQWTGYSSSQRRIVHTHYTSNSNEANKINEAGRIEYTDGTSLILFVKQIKDKLDLGKEEDSYSSLISECLRKNIWKVDDL